MITLTNLSKRFDIGYVVNNINLKIKQGDIVGLLGPNGAGKTTTLRMLTGVLPPSKGQVEINGKTMKENEAELKSLIGYLPENNPLYDELTVEEHLNFWADLKGLTGKKRDEAFSFTIKSTGIDQVFYRPIAELSKGYRQRVGLSQAILTRPSILVLDEPTEGLDPNQRRDIQKLIKGLGKNRTVIIASHVLSEVAKICNRIIIIHKGKIVADDTPDNLRTQDAATQIVEVEIKGRNIASTLKSIKGVISVSRQNNNFYQLQVEKGQDVREKIFETAVSNNWKLLTMVRKQVELEDVFSRLTMD